QGLGFTLKEINELLGLKVTNINNCDDVHKMTDEKIKQIEEKVENLMKIKDSLVKLAESCERKESASDCLIIDTFDHGKC
ncbi:MAG: MerR family DNA-binding protein, partial [bacterium]|nr:MerR family DNA-binding protein [bacterium]